MPKSRPFGRNKRLTITAFGGDVPHSYPVTTPHSLRSSPLHRHNARHRGSPVNTAEFDAEHELWPFPIV